MQMCETQDSPIPFRLRKEQGSNGQAGASLLPSPLCSTSSRVCSCHAGLSLGLGSPAWGGHYQTCGPLGVIVSFCACLSGNSDLVPPLAPPLCPNDRKAELAVGGALRMGRAFSQGCGRSRRQGGVVAAGSAVLAAKPCPSNAPWGCVLSPFWLLLSHPPDHHWLTDLDPFPGLHCPLPEGLRYC